MRGILRWALSLLLIATPTVVMAKRPAGDNPAAGKADAAATATASAETPEASGTAKDSSSLEVEIDELRDLLQSQSKQLQSQSDQLNEQQKKMEMLEDQVRAANTGRLNLSAAPATAGAAVASAPSSVVLASNAAPSAASQPAPIAAQGAAAAPANPLSFQIGNAFITPIGFMDFTGVFRSKNAGGGIGSNFAGVPYEFPSSPTSATPNAITLGNHLTEARLSMQNSRIGFRVDALAHGAHVIGYMEADFLGNNPTNVAVSSNSNTLRSRLYWVDVSKNKWELLAGQTWSLITPGRVGISPIPGNIFFSQDIDVNYQVGLVWGRIPEIRFVYHPTPKVAVAVALDNQEQYEGGSAGAPKIVLPIAGGATVNGVTGLIATQLNDNTTTVNAPQPFPDVIAKVAFDPSAKYHVEAGMVERQFRTVVNTTLTSVAPTSSILHQSLTGAGAFLNANVQIFNGFRLVTNNFYSSAGGRYIYGQVPDLIVRPTGELVGIKSGSTVTGFEYTHKNTLLYSYYGMVYAFKNKGVNNGAEYGYGVDATGTGSNYAQAILDNKTIQEATIGFNQTLWRDPKFGALNFMGQFSYLLRNPWSVAPTYPSGANLSMGYINLRYTLPGAAPAVSALK